MHNDDLKMIWVCHECSATFVFHSDVEVHREKTEHSKIGKYNFLSDKSIDIIGSR